MKKYELTNEIITIDDDTCVLYRIRALRDIPRYGVKAGDLGGWVQSENNLTHYCDCWVAGNAIIKNGALINGNALVDGDAIVQEEALIDGYARVCDNALIRGYTWVSENAWIGGNALVRGRARIIGNASVKGDAYIGGDAIIRGNAIVRGAVWINGNITIGNNAIIKSDRDYLLIGPVGSKDTYITFYNTRTGIWVHHEYFNAPIDDVEQGIKGDHESNQYVREYMAAIECAKIRLEGMI